MTHIVGFEIHNMDTRLFQTIHAQLAQHDPDMADPITPIQDFVLDYLCSHSASDCFQRDIEAHLGVRRSTVSRILTLMERNGLITRESVPADKRLKKLCVTEKGLQLHESMQQARAQLELRLTQNIPDEDMAVFFRVLAQMQNNLR